MRRRVPASIVAVLLAVLTALSVSTTAAVAASTCSDSWGSDGHSGPWYVGSNQSLHGNTLVITCPNSTVAWSVRYLVGKEGTAGVVYYPIDETRHGTGSTSFSISVTPVGCNQAPWIYWSHVRNNYTNGDIQKPALGETIC